MAIPITFVNITRGRHKLMAYRTAWWSWSTLGRRVHQDFKTRAGAINCVHTMRAYGAIWGKL